MIIFFGVSLFGITVWTLRALLNRVANGVVDIKTFQDNPIQFFLWIFCLPLIGGTFYLSIGFFIFRFCTNMCIQHIIINVNTDFPVRHINASTENMIYQIRLL